MTDTLPENIQLCMVSKENPSSLCTGDPHTVIEKEPSLPTPKQVEMNTVFVCWHINPFTFMDMHTAGQSMQVSQVLGILRISFVAA